MLRSILTVTLELCGCAATWWILGRHSTRIQLARRQFSPSLRIPVNFWTTSICLRMPCLTLGSRVSYQDTIQNLRIRRPLCARDWWLLHHQPKTNTSMNNLPNQLFSLHRSHLVRTPIFQICRTFVSLWDLLYFWWNANCLSNSFLWKTDACNVEDINIPHITECFSSFSVTFIEDRFCLCALDHSPYPRMILILTTIPILLRRLQWWLAVALVLFEGRQRVSPFCHEFLLLPK